MASEYLSDFVRRIMVENNLSSYDVSRLSGGTISSSTVNKLLNQDVRSHSIETLTALAKGLGVSVDECIAAARGLPSTPTRFEIYAETFNAHDISESEWQMLETYFRDHVKTWQRFQKERQTSGGETSVLAPVVATITPGKRPESEITRDDVRRMINGDEILEIERRLPSQRKKRSAS